MLLSSRILIHWKIGGYRILLFCIACIAQPLYAQIEFEPGYYINNAGNTVNGYLKNKGWDDSPSKVEYKRSENDRSISISIDSVQEFGFRGSLKYQRFVVELDLSSYHVPHKDLAKIVDTVFLKVLVEGKASLYTYTNNEVFFFYKLNGDARQLIYKLTLRDDNRIVEKAYFKQQLKTELPCESIHPDRAAKTRYSASELINYFKDYNTCNAVIPVVYEKKKSNEKMLHIAVWTEFQNSSLDIQNMRPQGNQYANFDNKLGYAFGMEAEWTLSINRRKWRIFIQPGFQWNNNETEVKVDDFQTYHYSVDYQSVSIAMGLRYHIFFKNSSSIFLNALFLAQEPVKSTLAVDYHVLSTGTQATYELSSASNVGFGAGYTFKKHFMIECRLYTPREVMTRYTYYKGEYKTASLVVAYRF